MNTLVLFVWTNLVTGLCEWSGDLQTAINSGANYSTSAVMPETSAPAPTPDHHPNGIITPIIYMPSMPSVTNGFAVAVQPDGTVDTEHWYGSPTNTEAEITAAFDQKHKTRTASNSNRLTRIERIAVDLQQVDAQIEGTNWVDVVLTGISTTAGTWSNANQRATITAIKTALQATKDREQNLKVAVKNLRQATEKVRKEIEQ